MTIKKEMKPGDSQGREQRERKEIDRGILIEVILCFVDITG